MALFPALQKVLFASTNQGKYSELKVPLESIGISLVLASALQLSTGAPEVDEDQDTYFGNAEKKAREYSTWSGLPCLADDTGLEVEGLNGAPGIYSARFAGPNASAAENRAELLSALSEPARSRRARFVCTLVLLWPMGRAIRATGVLEGCIRAEERGKGGFGYDSIFEVGTTGRTLAELKEQHMPVKTHRLSALEDLISQLRVLREVAGKA